MVNLFIIVVASFFLICLSAIKFGRVGAPLKFSNKNTQIYCIYAIV